MRERPFPRHPLPSRFSISETVAIVCVVLACSQLSCATAGMKSSDGAPLDGVLPGGDCSSLAPYPVYFYARSTLVGRQALFVVTVLASHCQGDVNGICTEVTATQQIPGNFAVATLVATAGGRIADGTFPIAAPVDSGPVPATQFAVVGETWGSGPFTGGAVVLAGAAAADQDPVKVQIVPPTGSTAAVDPTVPSTITATACAGMAEALATGH